jgi:hypothetical protein
VYKLLKVCDIDQAKININKIKGIKMKKVVLAISVLALSACSTMQPPRYAVSVDNIQVLKKLPEINGEFASLNQPTKFSSGCRMMGPIEPADGLTIPQFITKAFNDELKMADKYSKDAVKITGDITKVEFSSISGLTNGYWDLGLSLNSTNGSNLVVNNKYSFKSGFDAITACNATADALSPAVQDLIKATVNHPKFPSLMKKS